MTKLSPEQEANVEQVARKWAHYKAFKVGLRAQIQRRIEVEMVDEVKREEVEMATAIQIALENRVPKVALKAVTSKNPGTLEGLLAILEPPVEEVAEPSADALHIEWRDGFLWIELDPSSVRETEMDRNAPDLWRGTFEVFTRGDGKIMVDPTATLPLLHGVTEWLRSDPKNETTVIEWIGRNPQ